MKRKKVSRLFLSPTNLFIFLFIYYYYFSMKSLCGSGTRGIYRERETPELFVLVMECDGTGNLNGAGSLGVNLTLI
jgi:hypothetical protein